MRRSSMVRDHGVSAYVISRTVHPTLQMSAAFVWFRHVIAWRQGRLGGWGGGGELRLIPFLSDGCEVVRNTYTLFDAFRTSSEKRKRLNTLNTHLNSFHAS